MILAHSIALDPTVKQAIHFARACGVARFAYNWALAEWKRQYDAGGKPSVNAIKAKWNGVRRVEFPWSTEVTKCASGQAIMDLGAAFSNFFRDLKKPKGAKRARYPKFKKKGQKDSFALWNDQFKIDGERVRIPNLGRVRLQEPLRFDGKIMGARIRRIGNRWHLSVQVELPDPEAQHAVLGSVVGVDLGISDLMVLSRPLPDGTVKIANPKARRRGMRRLKMIQRRVSRQEHLRRKAQAKKSRRQQRREAAMRKLHHRMVCVRKDAIHKATTAVVNSFETVVLEDLNVSGMGKNHALAGAVADAAFAEIRRQFEYKAAMRGGRVVLADRFFPSSKTCSDCGHRVEALPLRVRDWTCPTCGCVHDRDLNAAKNLEHLVVRPAWPEPSSGNPMTTHGEMGALAAKASAFAVKPPSMNRELNQCALVRTN